MRRLLLILALLWCVVGHGATPAFTDFNTNQFSTAGNKISLLQGGTTTNYTIIAITNTILVSSNVYVTNLYSTNITAETTTFVTNLTFMQFVTNLFVTQEYVSNLFVTNITVTGQGNGPWIPNLQGSGTNTTLYDLTVVDDFIFAATNTQPVFELVSNSIIIAEFDGTQWVGNGGGLTNLNVTGVVTNQVPATNVFSGGTLVASVIGTFTGDITTPGGSYATTLKNTGTAGTYRSITFDAQGRETSGSNPTTFSGYGISDTAANLFLALTTFDFSSATNLTYKYTTNSINTGTLAFGKEWTTNISGNITLGDFTLGDSAAYESMVIWVTNTGASVFTVTLSGKVQGAGDGHPPVYFSTNGASQDLKILVEHTGVLRTNSSAQHYW